MPELITEQVDIYQLPAVDSEHKGSKGVQITIGDLHANAIKLMFMLVKHGIVTNLSAEDYQELVNIYCYFPGTLYQKKAIEEFDNLLAKLEFSRDSIIRLIGDELADRGTNDYFILKILEKLNEQAVPVEIMLSNHSIEFIQACETQDNFYPPMLEDGHAQSMKNLQGLVEKGLVERSEILKIAENAYQPTLRAISYSLSADHKAITIYSHAAIGLNTIRSLAEKLEIEFKDTTAVDLARTIDNLNEKFQTHVKNKAVHTLYTFEKMREGYTEVVQGNHYGYADLTDAPFELLMWNRRYDIIDRPEIHFDYSINFVHGHDSHEQTHGNIFNLDTLLGKMDYLNQGEYAVLYSQGEVRLEKELLEASDLQNETSNVVSDTNFQAQQHEKTRTTLSYNPGVSCSHNLLKESSKLNLSSGDNNLKPTGIPLLEWIEDFNAQLDKIAEKAEDLKIRGHIAAAACAFDLCDTLKAARNNFTSGTILTEAFKTNCTVAIHNARPALEKHRGWKQILGNLALAIVGLGVFYVVTGLVNKAVTGNFLFFKTDSANKLDQLDQTIESIESMPAPKK